MRVERFFSRKPSAASFGRLAGRPSFPPPYRSNFRFEESWAALCLAALVGCLKFRLRSRQGCFSDQGRRSGFGLGRCVPSYSDWWIFDGGTGQFGAVVQSGVWVSLWWMGLLAALTMWLVMVLAPEAMAWLIGSSIQGGCWHVRWWLGWVQMKLWAANRRWLYLSAHIRSGLQKLHEDCEEKRLEESASVEEVGGAL